MGFSTPPGHRNPTYDENTNGLVDQAEGVNVPGWQEDPSSPFTFTAQTSLTALLSESYDTVRVHYTLTDEKASPNRVDCRVQGDTTTNYTLMRRDGQKVTGASEVTRVDNIEPSGTSNGVLEIDAKTGGVTVTPLTGMPRATALEQQTAVGTLTSSSGPVSQVTLGLFANVSGTIEVYGRDVG